MKGNTDLTVYNLESGAAGPVVLILAGVHGDEYEPMLAVKQLNGLLKAHLHCGKVLLVPIVNDTAYRHASRLGADGKDLARCCPGDISGSETMRAAAAVSALIEQSDYLIDLHTGGRLFDIYPMAGYMLHADPQILDKQREMAKAFGLPGIWGTDTKPNGRTLSVARDAAVPAIYAEFGGPGPIRDIVTTSYVQGCMQVLEHLGMLKQYTEAMCDWEGYTAFFKEDSKPDSGYLQGKMLASCEGVFKVSVKVGQRIVTGQMWGEICDPKTGLVTQIKAESNGLVLFVRSEPFVKIGESLGGILELDGE